MTANEKQELPQCALSLKSLVSDAPYHAVRMIDLENISDNFSDTGDMLWPEFLICPSEKSAHRLCTHLNKFSYEESRSMWFEEEPYLHESELRQRWLDDKIGVYEVVLIESLNNHPDLYRLSGSLITLNNIGYPPEQA